VNLVKRDSIAKLLKKYNVTIDDKEYLAKKLLLNIEPVKTIETIKSNMEYGTYLEFLSELIDIKIR
jgi:hypothetical protein